MARTKRPTGATLWLKDGWIYVRTPYDADFVSSFKARISAAHRKWDPVEKVWKVDPSQDDALVAIVTQYFGEPTILEDKEVVVVAAAEGDPYGALLRLASNEILTKVYRLIATTLHPDKGGSADNMTKANQAWAAIKADRGI